jgi:hypothetical protein
MRARFMFVCLLVVSIACSGMQQMPELKQPIKTSLGDLVKVENKDKVTTNEKAISPQPEEVIYVLSFEGKKEIEVKDGGALEAYDLPQFPLVDSNGKEFVPAFVGSPAQDGSLSNADIKMDGALGAKDGKWQFAKGMLKFPEAKVTLVYIVPKNASLAFKDGGQLHRIN